MVKACGMLALCCFKLCKALAHFSLHPYDFSRYLNFYLFTKLRQLEIGKLIVICERLKDAIVLFINRFKCSFIDESTYGDGMQFDSLP